MEYFGETKKLTKILNDQKLIQKYYGKDRARRIIQRLDEFSAAVTLMDIPSDPPPRCHRLKGDLDKLFAVDVSGNYRMIFEAYDVNDQQTVDKSKAVTVQIVAIDDYHGK